MRDWEAYVRARLSLPRLTPAREARIVREIASQLEDFYRDALARGLDDAEADAVACRQIADWDRMARDVWLADRINARPRLERLTLRVEDAATPGSKGLTMVADLLNDMRFAIRHYAKTRAFTLVAVLTLALGIGANSAIFSIVNGVLLQPLPYPEPDGLVRVHEVVPQYGRFSVAPANFLDWRQQVTTFERIAAYTAGSATLTEGETPERITNASVSWDLFELLRVKPILGRAFVQDEDAPQKNQVIVLSHGMWQRRFGGRPDILNRTLVLSGTPSTVVGVMPADFAFPTREVEYWVPIGLDPANPPRGAHFLAVVARLAGGTSIEQARAEMRTIAERLAMQYPESKDETAEVVALHEQMVAGIRPALLALLAAVGVVVLIACSNLANLLLVRVSVREKEMAIRTTLGAGRRRLITQMIAESVVLALSGGALGLLLGSAAIRPIRTLSAGSIPRVDNIAIDQSVLLFTLVLSLLTGIVFGLVPAWQVSRARISAAMKEGGRSSRGSGGRWLRNALVVAEVALSLVLLVGASLLLRSFSQLTRVDPGFQPEGVLTFRLSLPQTTYNGRAARIAFFDSLLERLRALPQVASAGLIQSLPIREDYFLSFTVQGRTTPRGSEPSANYRVVTTGSLETLGVPLRRGRSFTERDSAGSPMVAVVDEAFARRHFSNEDPIGRGIDIGNGSDGFYEIVGVVGDVHYGGLDASADPSMYVPMATDGFGTMWVLVRTSGDPMALANDVRRVVHGIDRSLPAYSMAPLVDVVSGSLAQRRFSMLLIGLFALIAMALSAVGLYGVISYAVSQRTQEIGVRVAMGARRGQLLGMVISHGLKLASVGVAIGLLGAFALSRLLTSMLFGVTTLDPLSYGGTVVLLLLMVGLACYVPARRAMSVDPIVALRYE
jgi:putative ABC transport system permease protein